ncbi:MAG: hypothetical protein WCF90_03735 [Methanomicrobiales archaeon]
MMDELFGTTVEIHPKTIQELEQYKIFGSDKNELPAITLKKPVLLPVYLTISSGKAPVFRACIDHKKSLSASKAADEIFFLMNYYTWNEKEQVRLPKTRNQ